jgi:hypothetical protein
MPALSSRGRAGDAYGAATPLLTTAYTRALFPDQFRPPLVEDAQQMAAHESARTTKLYDRRNDQVTLDEIERIVL